MLKIVKISLFIFIYLVPLWAQSFIEILPDTVVNFGSVTAGVQASETLTLKNNGSEPVTLLAVYNEEEMFAHDLSLTTIDAGAQQSFNIFFNSNQNIDYEDFLFIVTDKDVKPLTVTMTASGVYDDYYATTQNLWGSELKTALYNIIKDHTVISYSSSSSFDIWDAFGTTDIFNGDTIWDMYSFRADNTAAYYFTYVQDQCGNYAVEGDCYNKEHSFPKSWFDDAYPMYSDLNHIFATDGKVNGFRGNYPYGEVGSASTVTTNGSKVGTCSFPGYSGTVFEPIDVFKGDLARAHLYMVTRYEDVVASWENYEDTGDAVLNGTSYPCFEDWALNLLLSWHEADPVSQKERDRNEAVYDIQHNRNPYIDHPQFARRVFDISGLNKPEVVLPESMDMGNVESNKEITRYFAIANTGDAALTVFSVTSSNSAFEVESVASVAAEAYEYLAVSFTAGSESGNFNTTITVVSSDDDESSVAIPVTVRTVTGIGDILSVPTGFTVDKIYPNPFNPEATVYFTIDKSGKVEGAVYNLNGQKVKTLFDREFSAGRHHCQIDGSNLPSGVYLLSLQSAGRRITEKIVLLK